EEMVSGEKESFIRDPSLFESLNRHLLNQVGPVERKLVKQTIRKLVEREIKLFSGNGRNKLPVSLCICRFYPITVIVVKYCQVSAVPHLLARPTGISKLGAVI